MNTKENKTTEEIEVRDAADVLTTDLLAASTSETLKELCRPNAPRPPTSIEAFQAAKAERLQAERVRKGPHANQGEQFAAEVAYLEARQREELTERAASLELEQQEVAGGDALASAASMSELIRDIEANLQRREELQKELKGLIAAAPARVQLARDAMPRLADRRAAAGLPAPLPVAFSENLNELRSNVAKRLQAEAKATAALAYAKARLDSWRGTRAEGRRLEAVKQAELAKADAAAQAKVDAKEEDFASSPCSRPTPTSIRMRT